ncbi:hypothetical protein RJE57_005321, partial [Raoultella planticola]|nr:hypothetical protein [Raoultella planticola]
MKTHGLFNKYSKGKMLYPFILVFIILSAMSWLSTGAMPMLKSVVLFIIILATPLLMALL